MSDAIKANSVVSIDYTLRDPEGTVIDSSDDGDPLVYLHGHGNIVPGLETALTGKTNGESLDVVVPPDDGYGQRDPQQVVRVPKDKLPPDLTPEVGVTIGMQTPDGHTIPLTIVEVGDDSVKLDANHALAGETLHFSVTVREVREATDEELSHGHVHGPGGVHD